MEIRKKELEKYKSTWLTEDGYRLLRDQKPIQNKSLMRLIDDLIKKEYGKAKLQGLPGEENSHFS